MGLLGWPGTEALGCAWTPRLGRSDVAEGDALIFRTRTNTTTSFEALAVDGCCTSQTDARPASVLQPLLAAPRSAAGVVYLSSHASQWSCTSAPTPGEPSPSSRYIAWRPRRCGMAAAVIRSAALMRDICVTDREMWPLMRREQRRIFAALRVMRNSFVSNCDCKIRVRYVLLDYVVKSRAARLLRRTLALFVSYKVLFAS